MKIFLLILTLTTGIGLAQNPEPVKWTFKAGTSKSCVVPITLTAEVLDGWHLYSPDNIAALPLVITFENSYDYKLEGKLMEPTAHKEFDEIFKADISYYKQKRVSFFQDIKITAGHDPFKVKGIITGQVCFEDGLCLPVEQKFELEIVTEEHCH